MRFPWDKYPSFPRVEARMDVTVTERRAVTDDSIRLAEEFRQKALASVLESRPLPGNILGEVVMVRDDARTVHVLRFSLNGQEYSTELQDEEVQQGPKVAARMVGELVARALLGRV